MRAALKGFSLWSLFVLLICGSAKAEEGRDVLFKLEEYKPMYFVMSRPDTKIELSFKIQLLDQTHLYFGYTQLMLWEIFSASPYFKDLNYNPEVFYRGLLGRDSWIDVSPFEHESDGLGYLQERSWNRAYIRYHDSLTDVYGKMVYYSVKAWWAYDENPSNTDITEYRGTFEIEVTVINLLNPNFQRSDLTLRIYPGGPSTVDPFHGGQELLWQIKTKYLHIPEFAVEAFHGYGENLLNYRDQRFAVRLGFGF